MYAKLLTDAGLPSEARTVRCALLFTADGEMRWAEPGAAPSL